MDEAIIAGGGANKSKPTAHSQPTAFTAASMTAMLEWGSLVDHHEGLYSIVGLIGGGGQEMGVGS